MSKFLIIDETKKLPLPFFFKIVIDPASEYRVFAVYSAEQYTFILKDKIEIKISHVNGIVFDKLLLRKGELISQTAFAELLGEAIEIIQKTEEKLLLNS